MKRILIFCICLGLILAFGCTNTAAPETAPASTAAPETIAAGGEAGGEAAAAAAPQQSDDIHLFRLDAIMSVDEVGVTTVKGTDITFVPAPEGGLDTAYELVENDTVTKTVAPDVTIEFPMPEMDATVTISGAELDGEFRDFLAAHPGEGILFTPVFDGDAVTGMEYFYLP